MKFVWKTTKNQKLKTERNVSFEQILEAIADGKVDDVMENPNPKYSGQKIYILELNQYPHFVPFMDLDDDTRELITIIPSRKLKKKAKKRKE